MNVLVTGANGFLGKNLIEVLTRIPNINIIEFSSKDNFSNFVNVIKSIDFIYHLAGVNRSNDSQKFFESNSNLLYKITTTIQDLNLSIPILFSSSVQVEFLDSDYALSKRDGENHLLNYSIETGASIFIFRLQNVFGKWSQPNYNSVIATWCFNMSRNINCNLDDREKKIDFIYIDDVVENFINCLNLNDSSQKFYSIDNVYRKKLGYIYDLLMEFNNRKTSLSISGLGEGFQRALYSTFLSYLDPKELSYKIEKNTDNRGFFAELFKSSDSGQISISVSKPGVTRGMHYHNTKNEKFLVIDGEATIELRQIHSKEVISYSVDDSKIEIIEIIPGYIHSIKNTGKRDMTLLIWSNEVYDPEMPDTFPMEIY